MIKRVSERGGAEFSDSERHRYMLWREMRTDVPIVEPYLWRSPLDRQHWRTTLVVCGLNPSTADHEVDDPTCRREISFCRAWNCYRYVKVNAYAWRDTKPVNMWRAAQNGADIVGRDNDERIAFALDQVRASNGYAVAAWGTHAKPDRVARLIELARQFGVPWLCLGVNAGGSPRHPLYVRGGTPLQPWPGDPHAAPTYFTTKPGI